jgi:hypothetical protein
MAKVFSGNRVIEVYFTASCSDVRKFLPSYRYYAVMSYFQQPSVWYRNPESYVWRHEEEQRLKSRMKHSSEIKAEILIKRELRSQLNVRETSIHRIRGHALCFGPQDLKKTQSGWLPTQSPKSMLLFPSRGLIGGTSSNSNPSTRARGWPHLHIKAETSPVSLVGRDLILGLQTASHFCLVCFLLVQLKRLTESVGWLPQSSHLMLDNTGLRI